MHTYSLAFGMKSQQLYCKEAIQKTRTLSVSYNTDTVLVAFLLTARVKAIPPFKCTAFKKGGIHFNLVESRNETNIIYK